ncbi:MAG: hypothetical protein L3J41_09665 [Melioribacteraceae bacterium]|nr:hypothetical protein [Melioribacteraceae bacterium]
MKKLIKIVIATFIILTAGFFIGMPYLNNSFLENDLESILESKTKVKQVSFSSKNFSKLPQVVKKYLKKSIKNESVSPHYCQYKTTGKIKTDKNSEWLNVTSQNYYSATESDFIKIIETQNNLFFWTLATNKYINNQASTNTKFLSSIPTSDFSGNKLSRSYLVLYLLESVFCPTVLLPNRNVHWKAIDNTKALATIWHDNLKGTAVFHFNKKGEVVKIVTDDRYMPGAIDYNRETFTIYFANYKNVGGFNIPTYFEYQWNLAVGDFTFGRFYISEITYE